MHRWIAVLFLVSIIFAQSSAQSSPFRVVDLELADEQTARIIPLYEEFDAFYRLVSRGGSENFEICERVWHQLNEAFSLAVPADPHFQYMRRWEITANRIDNDVVGVIADALQASSALLPGADVQICLVPAPPDSRTTASANDELYAIASGNVIIVAMGGLERGWEPEMVSVIAHEYHHTVRNTSPNRNTVAVGDNLELTLLERIVTEGMAVTFAQMIVPEYVDPVLDGLSPAQEAEVWHEIEPLFDVVDDEAHLRYMLGGVDDVPYNAGYTIGYHIIQAYIANNPDVLPEEWTLMDGQTIYAASGYNP